MSSLESSRPGDDGDGCVAAVDAAVALLGEDLESRDARALAARLGDVERTIRKLEAVAVSIVASVHRRELFREDGHVSVRGWVKASIRASDFDVTQRVRTARLCPWARGTSTVPTAPRSKPPEPRLLSSVSNVTAKAGIRPRLHR